MNKYIVWFSGSANRYWLTAGSRGEALIKFAELNSVRVSTWLKCRKAKDGDVAYPASEMHNQPDKRK